MMHRAPFYASNTLQTRQAAKRLFLLLNVQNCTSRHKKIAASSTWRVFELHWRHENDALI